MRSGSTALFSTHARKAAVGREHGRRARIGDLRLDLRGRDDLDRQCGGGRGILRRLTASLGGVGGKWREQENSANSGGERD